MSKVAGDNLAHAGYSGIAELKSGRIDVPAEEMGSESWGNRDHD